MPIRYILVAGSLAATTLLARDGPAAPLWSCIVARVETTSAEWLPSPVVPDLGGCYADRLLSDDRQSGQLTFTLRPAPDGGRPIVTMESSGTLDERVIACARREVGLIAGWGTPEGYGRSEQKASLRFEPVDELVAQPPTGAAMRDFATEWYGHHTVRVVGFTAAPPEARGVLPAIELHLAYSVELELVTEGFELTCRGDEGGMDRYVEAADRPSRASLYGVDGCTRVPRHPGERVSEQGVRSFALDECGWRMLDGDCYVGDRRTTGQRDAE